MTRTLPPLPPDPNALIERVAANVPLFATAVEAHRQGNLSKARSAYLELVDKPGLAPICLHQLGMLAGHQGDHARAAELIARAIALDPSQPLFYQNLAVSLERQGNLDGALGALIDLGCSYQNAERHALAIPVYQRILGVDPARYAAHVNLGTGLAWLGEARTAIHSLLRAIALHAKILPDLAPFLDEISPGLCADGLIPSDLDELPNVPTGNVDMVEHALVTLGKALTDLGHPEEGIAAYKMALTLVPGFPLGHWNLALALLARGNFAAGWREYLWRWHWDKFPEIHRRLPSPEWRGESLTAKTILVWAEQGYGDAIQFAPMVLKLAEQAKTVYLEVTTPQVRLFAESFDSPKIKVIERLADPHRINLAERPDYVVPLMSLPALLNLGLDDLPLAVGYLRSRENDVSVWKDRLKPQQTIKVGLVWAGRPAHADDHRRSLPLDLLRPLFDRPGITWFSLQVGEQAGGWASDIPLTDLSPYLRDFADTASAITALDLVISVDTAVAHLAAGLGKRVWTMIPAVADWRWLTKRTDTPWYPTMRLYRQSTNGDWTDVIAQIGEALSSLY